MLQMTLDHWERQTQAASVGSASRSLGKDTPHGMVVAALLERLSTFTQQERIVGAVVVRALLGNGRKAQEEVIVDLCRAGKLSLRQQIAVALTLVETNDPEWRLEGMNRCLQLERSMKRAWQRSMELTDSDAMLNVLCFCKRVPWMMESLSRSEILESKNWRNPRAKCTTA